MKAKRKFLTPKERKAMFIAQRKLCGCGCGGALKSWSGIDAIGEHVHDLVALGCAEKPDALYLPACADKKTNGLLGDKHKIARQKRHMNGKTQYDKRKLRGGTRIKSPGFDKTKTKKMRTGKVVERKR